MTALGIFTIGIGVLVYIMLGTARQEDGPPVEDGPLHDWVRLDPIGSHKSNPFPPTSYHVPRQRLTLNPEPPSDTGDGYGEGWNWRMMFEFARRW